jgi:putative copper resistance protein D
MEDAGLVLTALIHALHAGAALLLFGALAFRLLIARPAYGTMPAGGAGRRRFDRRLLRFEGWSLALVLISWLWWLGDTTASMSARPLAEAFSADLLRTVLTETRFGEIWSARLGGLLLLGGVLLFHYRRPPGKEGIGIDLAALVLAGLTLAALAWTGHAPHTNSGLDLVYHLALAAHFLTAGIWLGGLIPFAFLLNEAHRSSRLANTHAAAEAIRRFSALLLISVGLLVLGGLISAIFLIGSIANLFASPYGLVLFIKLAPFAAMLGIAAVNRRVLSPRIHPLPTAGSEDAASLSLHRLWWNVIVEIILGIAVLIVAGVLSITPPPALMPPM